MVPRSDSSVDDVYARWTAKGVHVVEEPLTTCSGESS